MNAKQRVELALQGGKPDRLPIIPIYDAGYVFRSIGRDPREYYTSTSQELIAAYEESFLLHDVDGIFVHRGLNDSFPLRNRLEKEADFWRVTELESGNQYHLLPSGQRVTTEGRLESCGGISRIQNWTDLERYAPATLSPAELEASGRYWPLRYFVQKYPDRHFSFQTGTPMVVALNACGGYEEGLVTMAAQPDLFRELLARSAAEQCAQIAAGARAGGHSTWFTCYYTGADTISPRTYAEMIFPYELQVCQAAKDHGLFVLNWFLGDLMPILDQVMKLPLDALVLEQGRKGYTIDPVEIRRRVGPHFCLFGFGYENDYCTFDRRALSEELRRQFEGAGREGAFICGTPIIPPNAQAEAVDFYFAEARRIGMY